MEELEEIETMIVEEAQTWTEMWEQQRIEKGRREGESIMLLRQLEGRFGPLDEDTRARVSTGEADRLLEWGDRILTAKRLEDVFGD